MGIRRILNSNYLFTALSYIKNFGELGIFFAEVIVVCLREVIRSKVFLGDGALV